MFGIAQKYRNPLIPKTAAAACASRSRNWIRAWPLIPPASSSPLLPSVMNTAVIPGEMVLVKRPTASDRLIIGMGCDHQHARSFRFFNELRQFE